MSEQNIGDLLPLSKSQVGAGLVQTIDGRALHAFLKVGKDYSTWIKGRIASYGFVEGTDFVKDEQEDAAQQSCSPELGSKKHGGHNAVEYHLTLDMAKELAMVERNDQGKAARRYFIRCEQEAKARSGLTARQVGGIIKSVSAKMLEERLAPVEEAVLSLAEKLRALNFDPAMLTSVEYHLPIDILKERDVPPKGRRRLSQKVSTRLRRFCFERNRGDWIRLSRETGRHLFHVEAVSLWLASEGEALIADHKVQMAGQGVLIFPRRRKKPAGGEGE